MIFPLVGFFGDTVFWNRHFSLQVPWLPVGGKVLRLWSLRSCKNAFWGVKYLTMLLYVTQQQNLHRLQKKHLDWVRTGRKSLLLASSISTQWLLLNYFQWKVLSLLSFVWLTILLFYKRKLFWFFGQFRELSKETNGKNWGFFVEKKGREKHKWLR